MNANSTPSGSERSRSFRERKLIVWAERRYASSSSKSDTNCFFWEGALPPYTPGKGLALYKPPSILSSPNTSLRRSFGGVHPSSVAWGLVFIRHGSQHGSDKLSSVDCRGQREKVKWRIDPLTSKEKRRCGAGRSVTFLHFDWSRRRKNTEPYRKNFRFYE